MIRLGAGGKGQSDNLYYFNQRNLKPRLSNLFSSLQSIDQIDATIISQFSRLLQTILLNRLFSHQIVHLLIYGVNHSL